MSHRCCDYDAWFISVAITTAYVRFAVCQVNPDSVTWEFSARRNNQNFQFLWRILFDLVPRTPAATREIFYKKGEINKQRRNTFNCWLPSQWRNAQQLASLHDFPSREMGTRACAFLLINQFPSVGVLLEISQPTVLKNGWWLCLRL